MKIATVVGARPQFVKMAPVSRALAAAGLAEVVVHTGQHHDEGLSARLFEELGLASPQYSLGIGSLPHGAQTGRMLEQVEAVLDRERPDRVLVYGDTNSTLAGALAAAKVSIPVAHVEAGLRCFDARMPEEINRVLTDCLADLLLCPTSAAVDNLRREGVRARIELVGDVMYDAVLMFGERARSESQVLARLGLEERGFVLATVHRAANTDDTARLAAILEGLARVAADHRVVLPLHPRTAQRIAAAGLEARARGLELIEPLGYLDMLRLEQTALAVCTDSGGVQKEAFFCRVPCVTLRAETEWVETVASGWNRLVDADPVAIVRALDEARSSRPPAPPLLHGDGRAAEQIAALLAHASSR